jgi:predicted alpha-1,6-mannanase (GH76 family)
MACAGAGGKATARALTAPTARGAGASRQELAEAHRRADAATDALVSRFWRGGAGAFTASPGGSQAAEYWLSAQALDSVLDGVERTGGRRWGDVPRAFIAAQDARGWRRDDLDDESWMALALLRWSDLAGDAGARARAGALLDDIAQAWDETCCGARPGGIWWDRAHTQKATASNAGPVIAAVRLYERTGDPSRLALAQKVFAYWAAEMVDPATGQVADHLEPSGRKVWWRFTYNEGTMIGAALALYRATKEPGYLDVARKIAGFMRVHETEASARGAILSDGTSCAGDCEQFKGIAQRYLAELARVDPGGGWGELLRADADAVWELARDEATDTFGVDWAGPFRGASIATQSSASTTLELRARAAGPYGG